MNNTLNIAIEVNFGEATLSLLQAFVQNIGKASPELPKTKTSAKPEKPAEASTKDPQPEPAPAQESAPAKGMTDDLPVSDEELRAAVKAAKDNTSAADVKSVFAQFGIKTSIECPDAKRFELLDKLNELAKR